MENRGNSTFLQRLSLLRAPKEPVSCREDGFFYFKWEEYQQRLTESFGEIGIGYELTYKAIETAHRCGVDVVVCHSVVRLKKDDGSWFEQCYPGTAEIKLSKESGKGINMANTDSDALKAGWKKALDLLGIFGNAAKIRNASKNRDKGKYTKGNSSNTPEGANFPSGNFILLNALSKMQEDAQSGKLVYKGKVRTSSGEEKDMIFYPSFYEKCRDTFKQLAEKAVQGQKPTFKCKYSEKQSLIFRGFSS